jgi:hypothetical protein
VPLLPQAAAVTITEKAERLLLDGAVSIYAPMAMVRGDHGHYRVIKTGGGWRCTCPARKKCAHIEAVERVTG